MKMTSVYMVPGDTGALYEYRKVKIPKPKLSQVLIKVKAAGVNRGELTIVSEFVSSDARFSAIGAGLEFAGDIIALGPDATGWHVGDRVMGRFFGSYSEYMVAPSPVLIHLPDNMSYEEGAAIPNTFMTSYDALTHLAHFQAGEDVVITAGSSGIGIAAIQIARNMLGANKVIATTRGSDKVDKLLEIGATDVINTKDPDYSNKVLELTGGKGADVIIDVVGGVMFNDNVNALALEGRFVSVGRNAGVTGTIDLDLVAQKRARIIGATYRTRSPQESYNSYEVFKHECMPAFEDGRLRPVIDKIFPLKGVFDAHRYMLNGGQVGKILLVN